MVRTVFRGHLNCSPQPLVMDPDNPIFLTPTTLCPAPTCSRRTAMGLIFSFPPIPCVWRFHLVYLRSSRLTYAGDVLCSRRRGRCRYLYIMRIVCMCIGEEGC